MFLSFPCGSAGKESICNVGDLGLISGLGRFPGEGKDNKLILINKLSGPSFCYYCSVTRSCAILWLHGLKCTSFLCPFLSPGVCSNSCPLSEWCHPTISSSATSLSFCLQSFPVSESFPMSHIFASDSQNIGASASASVLPMNIQDWFPFRIDWFDLLEVKGLWSLL